MGKLKTSVGKCIILLIFLCSAFLLSVCQSYNEDSVDVDMLSTPRYSDITGSYFEETANGYRAAFLSRNEIQSERIANSINSRLSNGGYYQYTLSDPASWNMFIYYIPEDGLFGYYSFRFSVIDSIVRIYVVSDESSSAYFSDYMLILVQAPRGGIWPSTSELYVNGDRIEMQDATSFG